MFSFNENSGASRLATIFLLALTVLGVHTGWIFFDARVKMLKFEDLVKEVAKKPEVYFESKEAIVDAVMHQARRVFDPDTGAPISEDLILVDGVGSNFRVRVDYVLDVKTPFFTYKWRGTVDAASSYYSGRT